MQVDEQVLGDVMRRLHGAERQLRGVVTMLESGRDCVDVLTQLLAVSHALNGAGFMILTDGLRHSAATQPVGADQAATVARLEKLFLSLA